MSRQQIRADLQARIGAIEGQTHVLEEARQASFSLGVPQMDGRLPGEGLSAAALHEVAGADHRDMPSAFGFLLALVMRRLKGLEGEGIVLWCRQSYGPHDFGWLYGPGLAAFGFLPDRLLMVASPKPADVLWVLEEALRSQTLAAIVGEVGSALDLTATRRLQLAAEAVATPVFLLRPPQSSTASAASTRWSIAAEQRPRQGWQRPCWRADLVRCRGGQPHHWYLEWDHATHCFAMAAALANRPAQPQAQDGLLQNTG